MVNRSCASTRAAPRAARSSRSHSSAARAATTNANEPSVTVNSDDGTPSMTPVIARVRYQAKAMVVRVCSTLMAAIATKNPREEVA